MAGMISGAGIYRYAGWRCVAHARTLPCNAPIPGTPPAPAAEELDGPTHAWPVHGDPARPRARVCVCVCVCACAHACVRRRAAACWTPPFAGLQPPSSALMLLYSPACAPAAAPLPALPTPGVTLGPVLAVRSVAGVLLRPALVGLVLHQGFGLIKRWRAGGWSARRRAFDRPLRARRGAVWPTPCRHCSQRHGRVHLCVCMHATSLAPGALAGSAVPATQRQLATSQLCCRLGAFVGGKEGWSCGPGRKRPPQLPIALALCVGIDKRGPNLQPPSPFAAWPLTGVVGIIRKLQSADMGKVLEALRAIIASASRNPRFANEFNRWGRALPSCATAACMSQTEPATGPQGPALDRMHNHTLAAACSVAAHPPPHTLGLLRHLLRHFQARI